MTPRSDTSPRGDACLPTPRRVYKISLKFLVVIPRTPESCAKHLQSCTVFKASVIGSRPAPTVVATSPLQHCVPTCWRKVCLRSWVIWKYTATGLVGVPDCRSPTEFFVHEQVATSRRLIFCSRRFNMSSWLASSPRSPAWSRLIADHFPTTHNHSSCAPTHRLPLPNRSCVHADLPDSKKPATIFLGCEKKIVAGFSNLQRAPDHTSPVHYYIVYSLQSHCAKLAQSCIPVGYHGVSLSHKSAGPFVPTVPNGTLAILVVITMSTAPSFGSAVSSVTKRHARVGLNSYHRVPFHDQTWTPMR